MRAPQRSKTKRPSERKPNRRPHDHPKAGFVGLESRRGPHPDTSEPSRFCRKNEAMGGPRVRVSRRSKLSRVTHRRSLELLCLLLLIPSFAKGSAGGQTRVEPFHPELNLSR